MNPASIENKVGLGYVTLRALICGRRSLMAIGRSVGILLNVLVFDLASLASTLILIVVGDTCPLIIFLGIARLFLFRSTVTVRFFFKTSLWTCSNQGDELSQP